MLIDYMLGLVCEHMMLPEEDAALLQMTSSDNMVWASTKIALAMKAAAGFTTQKTVQIVICCKDL